MMSQEKAVHGLEFGSLYLEFVISGFHCMKAFLIFSSSKMIRNFTRCHQVIQKSPPQS